MKNLTKENLDNLAVYCKSQENCEHCKYMLDNYKVCLVAQKFGLEFEKALKECKK